MVATFICNDPLPKSAYSPAIVVHGFSTVHEPTLIAALPNLAAAFSNVFEAF